jgi:signal transduction histidine kinase
MLSVVLLAIVLASGTSAYLDVREANGRQEKELARVVAALGDPTYGLSESVLATIRGLSGAEFVVFAADGQLKAHTLALKPEEVDLLRRLPAEVPVAEAEAGQASTSGGATPRPQRSPKQVVVPLAARTYLATCMLLTRRGTASPPGRAVVLYGEGQWWAGARQAAYPTLITGALAALAVLAITTVLARRFVRPIQELGRQTAAIAQGQFQPVGVAARDDEIRDLALSINRMTETLGQYEQSVRRSERLRTLGQLGAGMAHQLRNSATGAWMAVDLHQRECPAGAESRSLEMAIRQLRLMESYLQRFLTLGRPAAGVRQRVDLEPLVRDVLGLVGPVCSHAKIDLGFEPAAEPLAVLGDAEALRQVLVNLILNAVEAAGRPGGGAGKVRVALSRCGREARLAVKDSGPGPAPAVRDRLFEPFVSEKPEGTGLGLFVAREVAEAHQGTLGWQQTDGMTCFTLQLPLLCGNDTHGPPAGS